MILIATDEAGYGPTLGPLVVTATRWNREGNCEWNREDFANPAADQIFRRLREPLAIRGGEIVVDDSKKIHQPRSKSNLGKPTFEPLVHIAAAAMLCCGYRVESHDQLRRLILPPDDLVSPPWLDDASFDNSLPSQLDEIVEHWNGLKGAAKLVGVRSRSLHAAIINQAFDRGLNKADLLGETTMQLVADAVKQIESTDLPNESIHVFCDRLGGRRYYAGLIQHHFADAELAIVDETPSLSRYALKLPSGRAVEIRYTVKGDSYPPVAMSSCISKYLREAAMRRFNAYFASRIDGLRATAGYPLDAARFLKDIARFRRRENIRDSELIRSR